jgi:dUTP pyrophosphatase
MLEIDLPIKLPEDSLGLPFNKRPGEDAGYDLIALKNVILWPFCPVKIPVNIQTLIPTGYFGRVTGRSGLSSKGILTLPGTVDSGYTGVWQSITINLTLWPKRIRKGNRVAQMIILPFAKVNFCPTDDLPSTARGQDGFMSSGI